MSISDYACFEALSRLLFLFPGAPAQRDAGLSVQEFACDRLLRGYVTHLRCVGQMAVFAVENTFNWERYF